MEVAVQKSDSSDIPKKPRSAHLKNVYVDSSKGADRKAHVQNESKGLQTQESLPFKIRRPLPEDSVRKRIRKEESLSSFGPLVTKRKRRNSLNSSQLKPNVFSSGVEEPEKQRKTSSLSGGIQNFGADGGLDSVEKNDDQVLSIQNFGSSSGLGDAVVIPKGPHSILKQRKLDKADNLKTVENDARCTTKISCEAQINETSTDAAVASLVTDGKRKKKHFDVVKNVSVRVPPFRGIKGEKNTRRRKRNLSSTIKADHLENKTSLANDGKKFFEDFLDDDLEQNAARMLSSRFDPSCTVFLGSDPSYSSKSADGLNGNINSSQLESSTIDADGRMLRPRKRNGKSLVRKRRHFYEVNPRDVDPYYIIKQRIRVFWPLDKSWYFGSVKNYDPLTRMHHVKYDDRDEEWIDLQNERIKLLLFPSEISGKFDPGKTSWETKKKEGDKEVLDDSRLDNCTETEPIIAWLTKSKQQVKLSSINMMKRQRGARLKELDYSMLSEPKGQSVVNTSNLFSKLDMALPEAPVLKSHNSLNDSELSFVYFRKKFRKRREGLNKILEHGSVGRNFVGSMNILASIADSALVLDEFNVFGSLLELKQFTMKLSLQQLCIHDFAFERESSLWHGSFLLQFSKLMKMWPTVNMEIVLVDNILGLRLLSFEGSLKCSAVLLCLLVTSFSQHSKQSMFKEMQLPFTSTGISLSGSHDQGVRLHFFLYRFLEMERSKWRYLEHKLKSQCVIRAEIPVVEFTSSNFKNVQNASSQMFCTSACKRALPLESFTERSYSAVMHQTLRNEVSYFYMNPSVCYFDETSRNLPFYSLPSATSPSFVMSLHIKSLLESNVTSVSLQENIIGPSQEFPNGHDKVTTIMNDSSPFEDPFDQISDVTIENLGSSSQVAANSANRDVDHLKVDSDALSVSNDGDYIRSSDRSLKSEVNMLGNSVGEDEMEVNENDEIVRPEGFPSHTGSSQDAEKSCSSFPDGYSSPEKSEGGYESYMNNHNAQTQSLGITHEQSTDKGTLVAQSSFDLALEMNEYPVESLNPSSPRNVPHTNGHSSLSSTFGQYSKLWPEDFMRSGFISGSKKPRTHVSYSLPFGGYDLGWKRRSHNRRPRSFKKVKTDNSTRMMGTSVNSQSYLEPLMCNANVLVTSGDKGWRECEAQVGLESDDQKDWKICVKFSGVTKYVYKAQHVLQPGITNRHTHAMMWKGGKDWTLEFTDRSQWSLYKEIHEECYNRNIRALYVKNIPIPGVRLVADDDVEYSDIVGPPFLRSSSKYYRQFGTDVDMALDPAHVLYDMDTDDEKWVSEMRNSVNINGDSISEVTDDMFERVMDIFEKFSYAQECDEFSSDEIEEFMADVGPVHVVKIIYEYWRKKRLKKGLPLMRQFQPALWEQYQQQLREWESAMSKMPSLPDGGLSSACQLKKPAMFAFCLRPRGLEMRSKGLKQRSHKKFVSTGYYNSVFARGLDGFHPSASRRTNGLVVGNKRDIASIPGYDSSDSYHSNEGSERSRYPNLLRINSSSKRRALPSSPRDFQTLPFSRYKRLKKSGGVDLSWGGSGSCFESMKSMNNRVQRDGLRRHRGDMDEFRLRDASSMAQHAVSMARMKRERAHWLHHRADLAIHKATVALMIAEAIQESKEEEEMVSSDDEETSI